MRKEHLEKVLEAQLLQLSLENLQLRLAQVVVFVLLALHRMTLAFVPAFWVFSWVAPLLHLSLGIVSRYV